MFCRFSNEEVLMGRCAVVDVVVFVLDEGVKADTCVTIARLITLAVFVVVDDESIISANMTKRVFDKNIVLLLL